MNNGLIAIDIGGTKLCVALAGEGGKLITSHKETTRAGEGPEIVLGRLDTLIRETASEIGMENIKGIAVGMAGPINLEDGMVLTPPSLPTWFNVFIKKHLEDEFQLPVWVENDADLAALGEHRFGAGIGTDHLIYLTVSTGIGGGVITDGKLLHGARGSAAEIGHMVIDPHGPVCNCGGTGHLEAMASGTAIARIAREKISTDTTSKMLDIVKGDLSKISAEIVVQAAREGNSMALEVMNGAGQSLGLAIVSLMHIFDPQVVIIGGGVSNAFDLLIGPINEMIAKRTMADFKTRGNVVRSALGDDSGIFGAVGLAMDKLNRA